MQQQSLLTYSKAIVSLQDLIACTDKKEKKFFLIQNIIKFRMDRVQTKSYMRKSFIIYEEMRKYLVLYEEAVSQHNFAPNPFRISLYMTKIFLPFFISVRSTLAAWQYL